MDGETVPELIQMYKWSCANCGCVMCMPESLNGQLRESHATFYCISGHANVYSKKTPNQDLESKLMNEYAKNAQLESKIKELEKNFLNRVFKK